MSGADRQDACSCPSPETDWAPEQSCGGLRKINALTGEVIQEPPLCEVHMKPWGHRHGCPVHDPRATRNQP